MAILPPSAKQNLGQSLTSLPTEVPRPPITDTTPDSNELSIHPEGILIKRDHIWLKAPAPHESRPTKSKRGDQQQWRQYSIS